MIGTINVEMEFFDEKNTKKKYNIIPKELEIGDDLSKLIINKYLFNNKNDKEVEELSLKYQILSKNTSLFAEIELSDKISNEMKSQIIGKKDDKNNYYSNDDNINFNINKNNIVMECYINDEENEEDLKENNNNNKNNMENKEYIMKIINSQDFIEGFWEYNDQTKYVKEKYLNKYNLIKSKLNLNDKTIITILVIYFIEKEHLELLNELNLIIQKAKLYIKKETNQSYEEIIKII